MRLQVGFTPTLVKLGSIARHAEELVGPGGHSADRAAIEALLQDPAVAEFMAEADRLALLPVLRSPAQPNQEDE